MPSRSLAWLSLLLLAAPASAELSDFGTSDGIAGLAARMEPVPEPGAAAGAVRAAAALAATRRLSRL